jgi:hypothetical protein
MMKKQNSNYRHGRFRLPVCLLAAGLASQFCAAPKAMAQAVLSSCEAVSARGVSNQNWRAGGTPYGLAYERWTVADFAALRAKVDQCGGGNLAWIRILERTQISNAQTSGGSAGLRDDLVNELESSSQRLSDDPTRFLEQLDNVSARVDASQMDSADKVSVQARISNARRGALMRKAAQDRDQAEIDKMDQAQSLYAEAQGTPATVDGLRKLQHLLADNRYRLPDFSFGQQNDYYSVLSRRAGEIRRELQAAKCGPLTSSRGLPASMAAFPIVAELGASMGEVVCKSYVATGHSEFKPIGQTGSGTYSVRLGETVLIFQLGRYVEETDAFFPPSAPLQRGVSAFRLEGVMQNGRTRQLPRGSLVNLLASYTGPWSEFTRELR